MAEAMQERLTDIGPPDFKKFLPPVIKENYGQWKYHEILEPGVMMHVAESGDKIYTVRCGSPRLLSINSIRKYTDVLHDKYTTPRRTWSATFRPVNRTEGYFP